MIKLKTRDLQDLVSKAVQCASNNKLLPITGLIGLCEVEGDFRVITTDSTNYLILNCPTVECEDAGFVATVGVTMFAKLIGKMTSEFVTMTLTDNYLEIKGNGTYKIELPMDETGKNIVFPNPYKKFVKYFASEKETGKLLSSTVHAAVNSVKSALATTPEVPCYMSYYVKDKIVGTDTYTIASLNAHAFDSACLLYASTLDLLCLSQSDLEYEIYPDGMLSFSSPELNLVSHTAGDVTEFSINTIEKLVVTEMPCVCEIAKDDMLRLLDRLSLFVSPYDKNGIHLAFSDTCLTVSSISTSGEEEIPYINATNAEPLEWFDCTIDVEVLNAQIKSVVSERVEIGYGREDMITLMSNNLTQVIALLNEVE